MTRKQLLLAARVVIWAALAISLWLLGRSLDFAQLRRALAAADARLLALTVVAGLPGMLLSGMRWAALVNPVKRISMWTTIAAQAVGYLGSAILPVRAGEAVRVELLSRSAGISRAAATGTVALDHLVNGVVMFAFAALLPLLVPVPPWMSVVIWGGMAGALLLALVLLRLAKTPSERDRPARLQQLVVRLRSGLVALRNPRAVVPAAIYSALAWVVEIATTMIALAAFHLPHDVAHAMAVLFGLNLALAIPSPPANLGTFELGAGMALVAFGGSKEQSAAFAIGLHGLQLSTTILIGLFFLPRFRKKKGAEEQAETEPAAQDPAATGPAVLDQVAMQPAAQGQSANAQIAGELAAPDAADSPSTRR